MGRNDEAERALLDAARIDPGDPSTAFALGSFYAQEGRWAQALPYAQRFQAASPRDERARALLGQITRALANP